MKNKTDSGIQYLPAYSLAEAAHYLRLPLATVRSWAVGRSYVVQAKRRKALPLMEVPSVRPVMLSFVNLVEAHVLAAITRDFDVPFQRVRRSMAYMRKAFGTPHPLVDRFFETDRRDLFVREAGKLVNITRDGQGAIEEVLEAYLSRVEWDSQGFASRLYPFTGRAEAFAPKSVVIDPNVAFGKPVLVGTNVPTHSVAERFKAGESPEELAEDFGRSSSEIWEAIRCELALAA